MTLKLCPMRGCKGDLVPHCSSDPKLVTYSRTCDIVYCVRCGAQGSLDGRWWTQIDRTQWDYLRRTIDALRRDVYEDELP